MELPPRRTRWSIIPHLMIASGVILTWAAFQFADDEITGKAEVSDAYGFTSCFLLQSYFLVWVPKIWAMRRRSVFKSLAMPLFILLFLLFLYFGFRAYFIQPGAAAAAVCLQLLILICLLCRME